MLKKVTITVALLAAVVAGAQMGAQRSAPTKVKAGCADMECEAGFLCTQNPGGNTYCARSDNTNSCQTKGCVIE